MIQTGCCLRWRTYAILRNVKLDGGRIDYHPPPGGSSEQPPEKLPLTFYNTEPRATIELVHRRAHGNDTVPSLTCAPDLVCRQCVQRRAGSTQHAIAHMCSLVARVFAQVATSRHHRVAVPLVMPR